jgi:hypothetical protein
MEHRIEHDLSPELAHKAIERAIQSYSEKFSAYQPKADWVKPDEVHIGFNAKGVKISGEIKLVPQALLVDMDVPLLLRPFRKKAIDAIEAQVRVWIAKAHAGEL